MNGNLTKFLHPHSLSQRLLVSVGLSITAVGLATLGLNYRLMQSDLETQVHNRAQSITQSLEGVAELRYGRPTVPGSSGRIAFKSEYLNDYLNMEWERPRI